LLTQSYSVQKPCSMSVVTDSYELCQLTAGACCSCTQGADCLENRRKWFGIDGDREVLRIPLVVAVSMEVGLM
jgi:hypothetical protein